MIFNFIFMKDPHKNVENHSVWFEHSNDFFRICTYIHYKNCAPWTLYITLKYAYSPIE